LGQNAAWLHRQTQVELAPEQEAAVKLALTEKVAVLTGGPGCWKSFTVRSIISLAAAKHIKIMLAAKRLAEHHRT
jgi:exodeoxyribonuclease V alpha subunit